MKLLILDKVEHQTSREMSVFHSHLRTQIRAQAIVRLSHGLNLQQTEDESYVYLNSIEQLWQHWNKQGLAGMYDGHHTGCGLKWTDELRDALRRFAIAEGGSANILLRSIAPIEGLPTIGEETPRHYLHDTNFSYKRYRYVLKNASRGSFWHGHPGYRRVWPAPVQSNENFCLLMGWASSRICSGNRAGRQSVRRRLWNLYRMENVPVCWVPLPCRMIANCTGKYSDAPPCLMTLSAF